MTRARDLADSADKDIAGTLTLDAVNASGVITGLTVEATGDTAAGDNAALGYTAAEGLVLTGQGSTGDITIKNDADAVVLQVPTGTTNVNVIGSLDVATNAVIDGTTLVTGVLTTTAATVFNGGFASNANSTIGTNKKLIFRDSAIHISSVNDGDLMIAANDEIDITSTLIDINGTLDVSGATHFGADVDLLQAKHIRFKSSAGGTIRASISAESNDNLQFSTGSSETARMTINTDGKVLIGSATSGRASSFQIHTPSEGGGDSILLTRNDDNNTDMQVGGIFYGNAVDSDLGAITVKTVGATNSGAILFSTALAGTTAEKLRIASNGGLTVNPVAGGHAVFNEGGIDADFRIESKDNENMFFVNGDTNRIGIGTNAPGSPLDIRQNTTNNAAFLLLRQLGSGDSTIDLQTTTSPFGFCLGVDGSDSDSFKIAVTPGDVGSDTVLKIDNTGLISTNVDINTNIKVTNSKDGSATGLILVEPDAAGYTASTRAFVANFSNTNHSSAQLAFQFSSAAGVKGSIQSTGNTTCSYSTSSDERLKTDIQDLTDGLTTINTLKPRKYKWISEGANAKYDHGFVAQELYKDYSKPVLVGGEDPKTEPWSVENQSLVPILVKALQEADAKIEALTDRITALEG